MKLPSPPFVILDTETTGFVPRVNRVIEFASVRVEDGKPIDEYETLIAIEGDIPPTVQVLTRIVPDMLTGKPIFEHARETILRHLGGDTLIVGQNVGFDLRMLKGEGIDLSERPWVDTSMLASLVFPELKSYSLGYVSTILKLRHDPVHRALGDVHATLELFGKCWERLLELPNDDLRELFAIFSASSPGYRLLASALPTTASAAKRPKWLRANARSAQKPRKPTLDRIALPKPRKGDIALVEEPLSTETLQRIVNAAALDRSTVQWIAVKNLEANLRTLVLPPEEVRVIYPPALLLDPAATEPFLLQQTFTADEATLAVKLQWYRPLVQRDAPIHGEERAVWYGKLACTEESLAYRKQFERLPTVVLIDHQQLLTILANPEHVGRAALTPEAHVIVDDASMLEDTATKAFRWQCTLDHIRAAAEGHAALTGFLDLLQLWIERVRAFQDVRYLTPTDLETKEVHALRERLSPFLTDPSIPDLGVKQLADLDRILTAELLSHRIAWIEERQGGSQFLQSVPEHVGPLLTDLLYEAFPTSLLIPPGSSATLREILAATDLEPSNPFPAFTLPLSIRTDLPLNDVLRHPPNGKTIVLIGSRRIIEEKFVAFTKVLEEQGVALICQNLSGGLERMQAEFLAAEAPVIWLLTPWTFEDVWLPAETVDHLIIASLPFDHPSHTILSRRAAHYPDAFEQYFLPRLEHRLFRLLRAFCRHRTFAGDVRVTDERLASKKYGKRVCTYLERFARPEEETGTPQMGLF